jgi:hypothetical protein
MRRSNPPFRTIVLVLTIAAVLFVAFPVSAQVKPILVYYAGPASSSIRQALMLTDEITLITDPKTAEATEKSHLHFTGDPGSDGRWHLLVRKALQPGPP